MFEQQKNRKLKKNENWKNIPKRSKIGAQKFFRRILLIKKIDTHLTCKLFDILMIKFLNQYYIITLKE